MDSLTLGKYSLKSRKYFSKLNLFAIFYFTGEYPDDMYDQGQLFLFAIFYSQYFFARLSSPKSQYFFHLKFC